MFTHVVMFKLKDNSPEAVKVTADKLKNMNGKIPMLKSLEIGTDIIHSERSYDIVLIARLDSHDQLEAYDNHPVHLEVKAHLKQVLEVSKAVDFEA